MGKSRVSGQLEDAVDDRGVVGAVDDDQHLAAQDCLLEAGGFVYRNACADQGAGDGASATAGERDVLPEVARAEHRAKARHRGGLHLTEPVEELGQTQSAPRDVLQIVRCAGVALERPGVARGAGDNADRAVFDARGLQGVDGFASFGGRREDAGHRHGGNYSVA